MPVPAPTVSVALCLTLALGGAGGMLHASHTDEWRVLPSFARWNGTRAIRLGLLGNMGVAALAATVCVWALAGFESFAPHPTCGQVLALTIASVGIGFGAARLATDETDIRILREAVCEASAAPAAPLDTVRALEAARPWTVAIG